MKKKFTLFFAVFAFAIYSQASVAVSFPIPDAPKLDAEAYILIDAKTGEILAEYNADKRRDPASLTKIMTSYVVGQALKSGNITNDEMVTVSRNAWAYVNPKLKGSSLMFLEAGKKVSIADLNRGIIIESGNDAAIAIAEHIAGNQAAFIQLMNDFAQKLGLKNTRFNTVHGLDAAGQYTTAKDMAFLGQALIRDLPTEYEIYKEKEFTYALKQPQLNRNGLLWDKTLNVDGIKTGHTKAAGFNLVASAVEGDTRLISAVLGGRTYKGRELETKKLLVWGFRFFETANPIKGDVAVVNQPIWYGNRNRVALGSTDDVYLTVPKGRSADVKVKYQIDRNLLAPVAKGSTVGTIQLILDDKTIEERPLIVLENVNRAGFFGRVWDWIHLQINKVISLII